MDKTTRGKEHLDALILENVSKWQISKEPLAALTEEQLDLVYQVDDVIKSETQAQERNASEVKHVQVIDNYEDYIKFYVQLESDLKNDDLEEYSRYYSRLLEQAIECQKLFSDVSKIVTIALGISYYFYLCLWIHISLSTLTVYIAPL